MSKSQKATRRTTFSVGAAVAALAVFVTVSFAGKPPAPPPVPPASGTVFFLQNNVIKAMRSDGTGKTALPTPILSLPPNDNSNPIYSRPSRLVYGSDPSWDRIWLAFAWLPPTINPDGSTTGHRELFAIKYVLQPDGSRIVKTCRITTLEPAFYTNENPYSTPAWSNGGDSFISFEACRNLAPDYPCHVVRAWVTGAEIDAAIAAGVNIDLGPADVRTVDNPNGRVEIVASTNSIQQVPQLHTWSPSGDRVAYMVYDFSGPSYVYHVYVQTVAAGGPPTEVFPGRVESLEWQPGGNRLLISNGNISIIDLTPATPTLTMVFAASATSNEGFHPAFWSPDASQIVFLTSKLQGKTLYWQVERSLATGGSRIVLTSDLTPADRKPPLAWVPSP